MGTCRTVPGVFRPAQLMFRVSVLFASCHSLASAPCPGIFQQYMHKATANNVNCIC